MKYSFNYLDEKTLACLYKALVRPHLEYGNVIWSPYLKKLSRSIECVQRRATKLLHKIKHKSYTERMKALKLPSLCYRRKRGDMIQVFKIFKEIDDVDANQFFEICNNPTRGHQFKLNKQRYNTKIRENYFSNRVLDMWNKSPTGGSRSPNP